MFKANLILISVLAKAWYRGAPPHCSASKIINYVVANKAGPTLVAMCVALVLLLLTVLFVLRGLPYLVL